MEEERERAKLGKERTPVLEKKIRRVQPYFRGTQHNFLYWRNRVENIREHQAHLARASKFWKQLQLQMARQLNQYKQFEEFDERISWTRRMVNLRNNRELIYRASLNMENDNYQQRALVGKKLFVKNKTFEGKLMRNLKGYYRAKGTAPSNWVQKEVNDIFY